MSGSLALHQITVIQSTPVELVSIAAELGCDGVCVFVHVPAQQAPGRPVFHRVTHAMLPDMLAHLAASAVRVANVEYFPLTAGVVLEDFRAGLELGARLGAKRAVTHLHDADPQRGLDSLAGFAALAAEYGLDAGFEFLGLSAGCTSLGQALQLVRQVGVANLGVGVDALHLQRTGGTPAELIGVDPALLSYAQLCDGPLIGDAALALETSRYAAEAFDRMAPGEGAFPLAELVRALPPGLAIDVEVPVLRAGLPGFSALEHARLAVTGARRVLATRHTH